MNSCIRVSAARSSTPAIASSLQSPTTPMIATEPTMAVSRCAAVSSARSGGSIVSVLRGCVGNTTIAEGRGASSAPAGGSAIRAGVPSLVSSPVPAGGGASPTRAPEGPRSCPSPFGPWQAAENLRCAGFPVGAADCKNSLPVLRTVPGADRLLRSACGFEARSVEGSRANTLLGVALPLGSPRRRPPLVGRRRFPCRRAA
jgi:hypothetical protein